MKSKKATIHDIAKKLNITASTVSRALKNDPRISKATKKAVTDKANELDYQPNHIASALRSGKSQLIGVVVPIIDRTFFSAVIRGIEEVAYGLNYRVVVSQSNEIVKHEVSTLNALLSARVDGIIASLGKNTRDLVHYQNVIDKGVPLVLFDRTTDDLLTNQVVIDDYLGGYMATEHLIKQGYRKIVHFTTVNAVNIYKERYRGYRQALSDHGIPFDKGLVSRGDMQLEDGIQGITRILEQGIVFNAIFSSSDYAAAGAMQVLKKRGVRIPKDVGVVGFSNEQFTNLTDPPLTSIKQFPLEMGHVAAQLFFDALEHPNKKPHPKRTVLQPELVVRASSLRND